MTDTASFCACSRPAPHPGLCKVAARRNKVEDRVASLKRSAERAAHGTHARYVGAKCRCEACKEANRAYATERAKRLAQGITNRTVSAERARLHIVKLSEQGIGYKTLAKAAGVGKTIVQEVRLGQRLNIREETERRILKVDKAALADGGRVPAGPVWVMIAALLKSGYTKVRIARALGQTSRGLQLSRKTVTLRHAKTIRELYRKCQRRRFWTEEEKAVVIAQYADTPTEKIAIELGRAVTSVYQCAAQLGLKKSEERKKACGFQPGSGIGSAYRFPTGHVPANKGLRRPGYAPGRMADTQFKKRGELNGTARHNKRPVGTILADPEGYLRIKIREHDDNTRGWHKDVWPLLHHKVWTDAGRSILPGHLIVFKDHDRNNCDLENLEQISKAENMRLNSLWTRMPKELAELVQLTGAINRQINRRQNAETHK